MPCIFVVEDSQDLAWVLRASLSQAGYTVVTASNGLAALPHMRRQTPDLVISGLNMPVMDGLTLARRLRADPLLTDVPILFLTVHSDFPSKFEGFKAGADDYIVKPFDLLELHARIEAILRRSDCIPDAERDRVRVGGATLELATGIFRAYGHCAQLTETERDLLRYLMGRAGTPVAAQELMENVLDYPPGSGDPSTVRWHIKNLRQKIEAPPDLPVRIATVAPRGYCFHADGTL
jgi:two-component system response regulator RpaA